jgi:hypothetical protein
MRPFGILQQLEDGAALVPRRAGGGIGTVRWCRRAPLPRACVHLTRRTVASHTVEGVAVLRRDRLEARG